MAKTVAVWGWVWSKMDGGDYDRVVARLRAAGVNTLIGPKAWDGGAWMSDIHWKEVRDALKARMPELAIWAWGYAYPSTALADGERAAECVTYGQADGVVLDVEIEFENHPREAQLMCERFRSIAGNDVPLLYSTFALPAYHRAFPYSTFQRYCNGLVPQMYFTYWVPPTGGLYSNVVKVANAVVQQHADIGIGSLSLIVTADSWQESGHRAPTRDEMRAFGVRCRELNCGGIATWSYQHMNDGMWSDFAYAAEQWGEPVDPCQDVRRQLAEALTERDDLRRQVESLQRQVASMAARLEKRMAAIRSYEAVLKQTRPVAQAVADALKFTPYSD